MISHVVMYLGWYAVARHLWVLHRHSLYIRIAMLGGRPHVGLWHHLRRMHGSHGLHVIRVGHHGWIDVVRKWRLWLLRFVEEWLLFYRTILLLTRLHRLKCISDTD